MTSKMRYAVPALEKGLDILEMLAGSPSPLSLAELAGRLGRKASELFRMCACLEARGYLARDGVSDKFMLTLRLYELAHTHSPIERLLKAAFEPMDDFSNATEESCHLGIISRGALLIVAQSEAPARIRLSIEVGARFDLLTTASGRLLLADLSPGKQAALLSQNRDWRGWEPVRRDAFRARLAQIATTRLSTAENETILGVRDVVVPVGNPTIDVSAALACASLMSGRGQQAQREVVTALKKTARIITRRLGLTP